MMRFMLIDHFTVPCSVTRPLNKSNNNNSYNNSLFTINHPQRTNKDNNNTLTTKIHEKL